MIIRSAASQPSTPALLEQAPGGGAGQDSGGLGRDGAQGRAVEPDQRRRRALQRVAVGGDPQHVVGALRQRPSRWEAMFTAYDRVFAPASSHGARCAGVGGEARARRWPP